MTGPRKVNLGCGPVGADDWVNVDWGILAFSHRYPGVGGVLKLLRLLPDAYDVKWPKNLLLHNCKKRLPFRDSSVDFVYASHFLEHFRKYEAKALLGECRRVMKKGGRIRLVVPDLEILARKYVDKDREYFRRLSQLVSLESRGEQLSGDIVSQCFYPDFHLQKPQGLGALMTRFVKPHCWMYDYETLSALLVASGFGSVEKWGYRVGTVPDIDKLDVLPETSLYVEAER